MQYVRQVGTLELATAIFWFLFWIANGLSKFLGGVNVGIRFAEAPGNGFTRTLDLMGWGTGLGDAAAALAGIYELILGLIFLWVIIQFIMRTGSAARRPWMNLGFFLSAILFAIFAFANIVVFDRPTPLIWHATYFAIIGVSWLVVARQCGGCDKDCCSNDGDM